jgi:hypothetical protein
MVRFRWGLLATLIPLFFASVSHAIVFEGELTISHFESGDISLGPIKLRYEYTVFLGEPTRKFILWWESVDQFTEIYSIKFRATVVSPGAPASIYAFISPAYIPKQATWGMDVAGSPSWANTFYHDNGDPVSAETTKSIFRNGFTLQDLQVIYFDGGRKGIDKGRKDSGGSKQTSEWNAGGGAVIKKVFVNSSKDDLGIGNGAGLVGIYPEDQNPLGRFLEKAYNSSDKATRYPVHLCDAHEEMDIDFDVERPAVSCSSRRVDDYYYYRIVIGPLFEKMCWPPELGFLRTPADVSFSMSLSNGEHKSRYSDRRLLALGGYISFADRVEALPENNSPDINIKIRIMATSKCPPIESLKKNNQKNPFEKVGKDNPLEEQVKREDREELERLKKEAKSLGAVNVSSEVVILKAWDHSSEDGDRVRIELNGAVVRGDLTLYNAPEEIELSLKKGINMVVITALNEGTNPPNTASFTVTQKGQTVISEKWELRTYEKGLLAIYCK